MEAAGGCFGEAVVERAANCRAVGKSRDSRARNAFGTGINRPATAIGGLGQWRKPSGLSQLLTFQSWPRSLKRALSKRYATGVRAKFISPLSSSVGRSAN